MRKKKVALVYGGRSGEHDVSVQTAHSILSAMNLKEYDVHPIYIRKDGVFQKQLQVLQAPESADDMLRLTSKVLDNVYEFFKEKVDVVFPVIHGPGGEDGTLQGFLELAGVPYVGCGVLASSTGMDKIAMKKIFNSEGIPQCRYLMVTKKDIGTKMVLTMNKIEKKFSYPCFVKPANMGSSVGITKAKNREELKKALMTAATYDRRIIIEEMVVGRELEVGVLGNDEVRVSVVGEIKTSGDFYHYDAKYEDEQATNLVIPASIPTEVAMRVKDIAKKAFAALDGAGLSRIDFFWDEENDRILLNEINTMPGFTSKSMYPLLFKSSGISYSNLIDVLINLAEERFEEKEKMKVIHKRKVKN